MGGSWTAVRRFWRKLEEADPAPPTPPPLPSGRIEHVPGRGEMLVREIPGEPGQPTILLLHGWTLSADLNWFTVYDAMARQGRLLAIDQRGHGRGLRSEEPFSLEAAADDAAALLEHLDAAPAIVVGYSMGGSVGMVQRRRHPATVRGLVLQATGLQWRASAYERVLWTGMAMAEYGLRFGTPRGLTERYLRSATEQRGQRDGVTGSRCLPGALTARAYRSCSSGRPGCSPPCASPYERFGTITLRRNTHTRTPSWL